MFGFRSRSRIWIRTKTLMTVELLSLTFHVQKSKILNVIHERDSPNMLGEFVIRLCSPSLSSSIKLVTVLAPEMAV